MDKHNKRIKLAALNSESKDVTAEYLHIPLFPFFFMRFHNVIPTFNRKCNSNFTIPHSKLNEG